MHVSAFWALMLGILVLAVVILSPTVHLYLTQQNRISALHGAVGREQGKLDAARSALARWNDPSYVRSEARERLYFVMPGETSYLIIDDRPAGSEGRQGGPVRPTTGKTEADWIGTLVASTISAGITSPSVVTKNASEAAREPGPEGRVSR
jgi:cell division protein FtsB